MSPHLDDTLVFRRLDDENDEIDENDENDENDGVDD